MSNGNNRNRTIKLIFGACCFSVNLVALITGVILIFKCLPFIGEGEASVVVKVLGEITGVNGYAVGLFLGVAIVFVSLMYTHKSYQEDLRYESPSFGDLIRHHAPRWWWSSSNNGKWDAPQFRGCLTIQNHGKKKPEQGVIPKNKQLISRNIQLWDSLFIAGWRGRVWTEW